MIRRGVIFSLALPLVSGAQATALDAPLGESPRLLLFVVLDQFRADYLFRFHERFLPASGRGGGVGGFAYLLRRGAYYPYARAELFQGSTAPCHATLLTGAYPYRTGVPSTFIRDRRSARVVRFVSDQRVSPVGASRGAGGSPWALLGPTLGDALKISGRRSEVIAIALKDKAAVLLAGHRADLALWFDETSFSWVSSTHYLPRGKLPSWVTGLNAALAAQKGRPARWRADGPSAGRGGQGFDLVLQYASTETGASRSFQQPG